MDQNVEYHHSFLFSNTVVVIASTLDQVFLILSKIPRENSFAPEAKSIGLFWEKLEFFCDNLRISSWNDASFFEMIFMSLDIESHFRDSLLMHGPPIWCSLNLPIDHRWISMNAWDVFRTVIHYEIIRITSFRLTQNTPVLLIFRKIKFLHLYHYNHSFLLRLLLLE